MYNFVGEELFTCALESDTGQVRDVFQVQGPIFLVSYCQSKTLKLIKADESERTILSTIDSYIPTYYLIFSFELIKTMGESYLYGIGEDTESPVMYVSLTDIWTGKHVLKYQTNKQESLQCSPIFNWNLTELALHTNPNSHVNFVDIGPFDLSLKHVARLTCLKWFNEDYLNQNLPVCLRKYLGVCKEHYKIF